MRLLFLDGAVLLAWGLHLVSEKTKRRLNGTADAEIWKVAGTIKAYQDCGLKPSCTIGSAAEVVTRLFKGSALPFEGEYKGFQERKSLAAEAAAAVRGTTELLAPTTDHFTEAEALWLAWCSSEAKESYAQFSD